MSRPRRASLLFVFVLAVTLCGWSSELPRLVNKDGRFALLVDGKPFLILGGQINNSSAWPGEMPKVWPVMEFIGANTLEAPVYWEQLEPTRGSYDFANVDMLIQQSREHKVHLVLLWFGAWKNGAMHYTPEWVKVNTKEFPRFVDSKREPMDILSPHFSTTLAADKAAFRALMKHLREVDGDRHTVLMVQVENEVGTYGTTRDFSPEAQKHFDGQVPAELARALNKQSGTWKQVFGDAADETFAAYSIARYVDEIAKAGKAEFPLPMYINVALRDPLDGNVRAGANYPSGGATDNMLDVWKATATSIDLIAPDIYISGDEKIRKVQEVYTRPDNALFIPEVNNLPSYGKVFFQALGYGAIGFSPFGMDRTDYFNAPLGASDANDETLRPFRENFQLIGPMQREIAALNFEGKLKTAVERKGQPADVLDLGKWRAKVSYGLPEFLFSTNPPGNPKSDGRVLVAQLGADEFLVTGIAVRVEFTLAEPSKEKHMQYLRVEEGQFENGEWKFRRIWNGDQTDWGLNFKHGNQVLRVKLGTFKR